MSYLSWWISGIALSGVMLVHWFSLHRMMAVSGRVSALVDRLRHGTSSPHFEMSTEEMLAAIKATTLDEFGPDQDAEAEDAYDEIPPEAQAAIVSTPQSPVQHGLFLGGLVLGGALATAFSGEFEPTWSLHGEKFSALTAALHLDSPWLTPVFLAFGGAFVGFGTRMAGGCTSGHGLCGTSRLQPGSLLATLCFFATGIVVSLGIGALL